MVRLLRPEGARVVAPMDEAFELRRGIWAANLSRVLAAEAARPGLARNVDKTEIEF